MKARALARGLNSYFVGFLPKFAQNASNFKVCDYIERWTRYNYVAENLVFVVRDLIVLQQTNSSVHRAIENAKIYNYRLYQGR